MNLLTMRIRWYGWMFGILKVAMLSLGLLLGIYGAETLKPYVGVLWGLFAVTGLISLYLGVRSLQRHR